MKATRLEKGEKKKVNYFLLRIKSWPFHHTVLCISHLIIWQVYLSLLGGSREMYFRAHQAHPIGKRVQHALCGCTCIKTHTLPNWIPIKAIPQMMNNNKWIWLSLSVEEFVNYWSLFYPQWNPFIRVHFKNKNCFHLRHTLPSRPSSPPFLCKQVNLGNAWCQHL